MIFWASWTCELTFFSSKFGYFWPLFFHLFFHTIFSILSFWGLTYLHSRQFHTVPHVTEIMNVFNIFIQFWTLYWSIYWSFIRYIQPTYNMITLFFHILHFFCSKFSLGYFILYIFSMIMFKHLLILLPFFLWFKKVFIETY